MTRTKAPGTIPPTALPESGDPLGEALHAFRLEGVVYARSHLTAPWGVSMPPMPGCVMFHVVTSGSCVLEGAGDGPTTLRPGEFALMPRGEGHTIKSQPNARTEDYFSLPVRRMTDRYEVLRYGGGGAETTLICGAVCVDHPAARDLIGMLPGLIHTRAWDTPDADWMLGTLRLMGAEASAQLPGGETIVTRLADVLVVQSIRAWLNQHPEEQSGWLGALRDHRIGPALVRIQREPERAWTVASLASSVAMSRSAFSARFTELVGESPLQYVTRWRMQVAGAWLQSDETTAAECGARLGYNSEAAFNRAFKRVMGLPPRAWQRHQAQTTQALAQ